LAPFSILRYVEKALVSAKKKLCLLGVTDDATWKRDPAVIVFVKFTSENRTHVRRLNDLTIVLQTREKIFEERIVNLAALRMILNPKHERLIPQADLFDNVIGRAPSFDNEPLA